MANHMKLAVGGPVQAKQGTYLSRPADEMLFKACQESRFAYVLACRQIGKSSLMFDSSRKLAGLDIRTVLIDLNSIGRSVEANNWYFSLVDEIARKLELTLDVAAWWEGRPRLSTLTQRFLQFLREVVLKEISVPIVIFVDEIDMTLGLDFTDDFFAAIRSVHNDRAQVPAYQRLTFVLLGVATPDELISDPTRTPFNIGQAIPLRDFTKEECRPFRLELEAKYPAQGRVYFDQIYDWTAGHPFLTQKLSEAVLNGIVSELEQESADRVAYWVNHLFLAAEARGEDNLQFVQNRVTSDLHTQEMLKLYKRILENKKPVFDDEQSPAINRLKLYGLVLVKNGQLKVRNKLYKQVFDLTWTNEMLRLSSASIRLGLPDHYKILQEIGQGGFSTVYLAQLKAEDRTQSVALKVLKTTSVDDDNQVKRFKQEARALARLEHPHIIPIFETYDGEEIFFITMEYISGGTVRDRLKEGPLPRREAVHIVKQIGDALTLAHKHGIIHRDLKPGNILLDSSQEPVRPVLTDFGLIKLLVEDDFTKIQSTAVLGTLDYMAPEQWSKKTPTPATDVYALALTFFEMLSGKRAFVADSPYELMTKHATEPLPLLSTLVPEIGPYFDDLLVKAAAKEPAERYQSMADFIEALEAANAQAERVEQIEQEAKAATAVDAVVGYIQKGRYDPDRALAMTEAALEMYPNYLEALRLRGQIRWQQKQFDQALADYRKAYRQVNEPASEVGLEYLDALNQVAQRLWQRQMYDKAVDHYEAIRQVVCAKGVLEHPSVQACWTRARSRLVEYYHHEGDMAYNWGEPGNIDEAITILARRVEDLKSLQADNEYQDLKEKVGQLRVKKYEDIIKAAQKAIDEIDAQGSQARFSNDEIFQHYQALDQAYHALLGFDPTNQVWQTRRRQLLKERAEIRSLFALRALGKLDPDYEAALRHYRAILEIEKLYPGVSESLNLDVAREIEALQIKADHDGKYNEALALINRQEYARALDYLEQEFIQPGNYEHRDVSRWFWGLVHAKQHDGNFPPEWDSLLGFETLSKRLVNIERQQIQKLEAGLEPWSQSKILKTINQERKQLEEYEAQIESIEDLLQEALDQGVDHGPEIERCQNELGDLRDQIKEHHEALFDVDVEETVQKVEVWLQRIEDLDALLETGNPIRDIPEFLNRSEIEQRTIENDPLSEKLQVWLGTGAEIGRLLERIKFQIQSRLVRLLIDDVGERDEALETKEQEVVALRRELKTSIDKFNQAEAEVDKARKHVARLQQNAIHLKEQLEKPNRERQINRYVIPLSLALALLAGGIIAPQIQALPGLVLAKWIAGALLVTYFIYYVWRYYLASSPKK